MKKLFGVLTVLVAMMVSAFALEPNEVIAKNDNSEYFMYLKTEDMGSGYAIDNYSLCLDDGSGNLSLYSVEVWTYEGKTFTFDIFHEHILNNGETDTIEYKISDIKSYEALKNSFYKDIYNKGVQFMVDSYFDNGKNMLEVISLSEESVTFYVYEVILKK